MPGEAPNSGSPSPAADAGKAMGSAMVMDEISPFPDDKNVPDQSQDIADIFGLGEEAGPAPQQSSNSPEGATGGGASPPAGASAAEGGQGQAQPATPATPTPQSGQQGTSPQAPAQQPQQATPAAPSAAPVSGTAPAPTQDPTVQALQAQVQALTAHIAQLTQGGQQGAGQQTPQSGQGEQQPQQHPLMDYRLAMPDDVANAVFNEDPGVARQGLQHVINAVGREIHGRVIRHVDELIGQRLQSYGQQSTVQQQQERMRQEYFAAFPQHNDPATQLIVAQEAQVLWGANPALAWDENSKNALGARVNARLGLAAQQPQQQQQGQVVPFTGQQSAQQGQPVPQPAAQLGASPRPQANPGDNDANFIEQVLNA